MRRRTSNERSRKLLYDLRTQRLKIEQLRAKLPTIDYKLTEMDEDHQRRVLQVLQETIREHELQVQRLAMIESPTKPQKFNMKRRIAYYRGLKKQGESNPPGSRIVATFSWLFPKWFLDEFGMNLLDDLLEVAKEQGSGIWWLSLTPQLLGISLKFVWRRVDKRKRRSSSGGSNKGN